MRQPCDNTERRHAGGAQQLTGGAPSDGGDEAPSSGEAADSLGNAEKSLRAPLRKGPGRLRTTTREHALMMFAVCRSEALDFRRGMKGAGSQMLRALHGRYARESAAMARKYYTLLSDGKGVAA